VFGAKASNLARILAAGIDVPAGYVLDAVACWTATDEEIEIAARKIAEWAVGSTPYGLVVRSSALVEDDNIASHAGVFLSVFVRSESSSIAEAISKVRDSAMAERVRLYRAAMSLPELDPAEPNMAVLVQIAVRARSGGVLFSPQSSTDDSYRIESTWGLPTSILSGYAQPDSVLAAAGRQYSVSVAEKVLTVISAKTHELTTAPADRIELQSDMGAGWIPKIAYSDIDQGLIYLETPDDFTWSPSLETQEIERLLQLAVQIEQIILCNSLDLEWAFSVTGTLFVLQGRPQTSPDVAVSCVPGIPAGEHLLQGTGASPGIARGHAVPQGSSPINEYHDRPSILVAGVTGPDDLPAIIASAGIVSAHSGVLCHTAIVARELAKPCVVGVLDAHTEIPAGSAVELDGTSGTVMVNMRPSEPSARCQSSSGRGDSLQTHSINGAITVSEVSGQEPRMIGCLLPVDLEQARQIQANPVSPEEYQNMGVIGLLVSNELLPIETRVVARTALNNGATVLWLSTPPRLPLRFAVYTPGGELVAVLEHGGDAQ